MNASSFQRYTRALAFFSALLFSTHLARAANITVDFPGGTVAELVATIAKNENSPFNLVGDKEDLATIIPPVNVRNAEPRALAMALDQLLRDRGLNVSATPGNVFVLAKARSRTIAVSGPTPAASAEPRFESFQLARYLHEKQTIDDITAAIRTACEFAAPKDAASLQMKFHPGTSLLLVSGSEEIFKIVHKVVAQLRFADPLHYSGQTAAEEAARREEARQGIQTRRVTTSLPAGETPDAVAAIADADADRLKTTDPVAEAKRIQTVADEVRRRRDARIKAQDAGKAGSPQAASPAAASPQPEGK
jgi:hypothetical protein